MFPGAQWGGRAPLFLGALHRGAAPQVGLETGGVTGCTPPKELLSLAVLAAQTGGAAAAWTQKTPIFPGCGQAGNHPLLLCRCIGDGQRGSEQHSLTQCPQPALHPALGSPQAQRVPCVYTGLGAWASTPKSRSARGSHPRGLPSERCASLLAHPCRARLQQPHRVGAHAGPLHLHAVPLLHRLAGGDDTAHRGPPQEPAATRAPGRRHGYGLGGEQGGCRGSLPSAHMLSLYGVEQLCALWMLN